MTTSENPNSISIIYDGLCPICRYATRIYRLKEQYGDIILVDARSEKNHPLLHVVNQEKINLDDGMALYINGEMYHGYRAAHIMALHGLSYNTLTHIFIPLFRSKILARLLYPPMKLARRILLKFYNISKINNLHET